MILRASKYIKTLEKHVWKTISFGAALMAFLSPHASFAQSEATCAADFASQIRTNALLAAERHATVAGTLIRKPDSVLEYTCFDQQAARIPNQVSSLFSTSGAWDSTTMPINGQFGDTGPVSYNDMSYSVNMGPDNLDSKIDSLVFRTLADYLGSSFTHDLLGGSSGGDTNSIASDVSSVATVCDFLFSVYHTAKCEDFADDRPFISLSEWVGTDPRILPTACTTAVQITNALIDEANNQNFATTSFDSVTSYIEYFYSDPATRGNNCSLAPIPTGVIVQNRDYGEDLAGNPIVISSYDYVEKVCPSPGCYFDHKDNEDESDDECVQ